MMANIQEKYDILRLPISMKTLRVIKRRRDLAVVGTERSLGLSGRWDLDVWIWHLQTVANNEFTVPVYLTSQQLCNEFTVPVYGKRRGSKD